MATEFLRFPAHAGRRDDPPRELLLPAALLILCIDIVWCVVAGWRIPPRQLLLGAAGCAAPLALLAMPRYRNDFRVRSICTAAAQFVFFTNVAALLSYLVVSTHAPLADATFARWDRWLGFDWPGLYRWLHDRPRLDEALAWAYGSALFQMAFLIVYLSLRRQRARLVEFFNVVVIAFVVTTVIAGWLPAAGAAKFYWPAVHADLAMWSDFEPLRAGTLKSFDLLRTQGLFSFPSFHTVTAVALAYAMRRSRLFPLFLVLNALVIAATPTHGGHYLVDVLAGLATVAAAIAASRSRPMRRTRR